MIRIRKVPFIVIGVLARKGQSTMGEDQDDVILIPLSTAKRKVLGFSQANARAVGAIVVKVREASAMAVGARRRDILSQFLVEAITVSLVGGCVGIGLGVVGSYLVGYIALWRIQIQPAAILLAFGFAAMVGIFFGFYPARKASRLDPIEAMRYE